MRMGLSRESGKVNFSRADPFGALRRTDILSHDNDNRRRPSPLAAGNNDDVAMTNTDVDDHMKTWMDKRQTKKE